MNFSISDSEPRLAASVREVMEILEQHGNVVTVRNEHGDWVSRCTCDHQFNRVYHPDHDDLRDLRDEHLGRVLDRHLAERCALSFKEFQGRAGPAGIRGGTEKNMTIEAELKVGDHVEKPKGYPFPGVVVAAFRNLAGDQRYVVESDAAPGMLHIFAGTQLAAR